MNQTLEGYISRFWKNIFRPKYIDLVRSVQSCKVYRYVATSVKHFSVTVGCHGQRGKCHFMTFVTLNVTLS